MKYLYFFGLLFFYLNAVILPQPMSDSTQLLTLKNQLQVVLVQDPSASLISVRTYIRAGSIHEESLLGSGASHYLEHLVAGGSTYKRKESEYKSLISKLGGAYNAYTTVDHTSYYINTTPEYLETAITILYEWMFFHAFEDKEFNRERDVIIKEIEKNDANLSRLFYQAAQENFYKVHPLGLPVIGYKDNFNAITKPQLQHYYKTHYVPSNMVLVIGGNFDQKKVIDFLSHNFGKQAFVAPPKSSLFFEEPLPFVSRIVEKEASSNVTMVSFRFPTTTLFSKDLYPLDLLDFILGNGENSILYTQLVETKKLAYSVSCSSYTPAISTGYFEVFVEADYVNLPQIEKEILKILSDIKLGHLDTKKIEYAKKQKLAEDIMSINSIEDKVSKMGQSVLYGHTTTFFTHYVSQFKEVTLKDITRVSNHYLDNARMVKTILKPHSSGLGLAATSQEFQVSTLNRYVLKNGVRVLINEDHSVPRVLMQVITMGGIRSESTQTNGIGALLSESLGKASKRYKKEKIRSLVEGNGAFLSGSSGNQTFSYQLGCLSEDFKQLLPVFLDTYLNPVFNTEDVKEAKRKQEQLINQRPDDWFNFGYYHFKKNFFNQHPYGLSAIGEKESLSTLDSKALLMYLHSLQNPEKMIITVFGDIDSKTVLAELEKSFSNFKYSSNLPHWFNTLPRPLQSHSQEFNISISQDVAAVFIGFDSAKFDDKMDAIKLDLLDAVLSGMTYPSGRLHHILREKGLVYMTHAVNRLGIEEGHFMLYALTSEDKLSEVKTIMLSQIQDLCERLVSDEEFDLAIAQLKYYYKERISTLDQLSLISATDELYGLGYLYSQSLDSFIQGLKKEDIQDMAKTYLKNPQIFIFKKGL